MEIIRPKVADCLSIGGFLLYEAIYIAADIPSIQSKFLASVNGPTQAVQLSTCKHLTAPSMRYSVDILVDATNGAHETPVRTPAAKATTQQSRTPASTSFHSRSQVLTEALHSGDQK